MQPMLLNFELSFLHFIEVDIFMLTQPPKSQQMFIMNPVQLSVETPRLKLREYTSNDAEAFYKLESIPEIARYQEWEPRTREEAARLVQKTIEGQTTSPRKVVELAAVTREDGAFIGRVGGLVNHVTKKADLWFSFLPQSQGKGFAREAMEAFIPLLLGVFGVKRCEIECDPRNLGSRRLAERLGFDKVSEVERVYECKGEWVGSAVFAKNVEAGS